MASCSEKKGTLSTPSHFQKVSRHNLIPPSTYSNQTTKNLSTTIKTPLDFTLKQSNTSSEMEKVTDALLPTTYGQNINVSTTYGQNINVSNSLQELNRSDPALQSDVKGQERTEQDNINNSCSTTKKTDVNNEMSNRARRPPPGLQHPQQVTTSDGSVSDNNSMLLQEDKKNDSFDNFECYLSNDGTVSRKAYEKLENMYNESKDKLDNLEMKFFKIMKASGKQRVENNNGSKNENDYEEKLTKQLEAFKFQNEFLCNKLQKYEHGEYPDVKGAVDRYLSQNQYENEKVMFNNKILELERSLFENNKENENLLKDIEVKDLKYEKAMIRNNEERYSYEECIAKLNVKISEMIDENEKLRNEKDDCLLKYEDSLKRISEVNQIIENKNKNLEDVSKKMDNEINKNNDLNKKIEKQRETYESALANVEKMLKEEVVNNSNINEEIKRRDNHIKQLENKLNEMNLFTHELQHDNENINILKKHFDTKCGEIIQLQNTCRSLQSTNGTLNIRINSLNEMLRLQEPYTKGFLNGEKEKMLEMWREKVYSLLVLLKLQEMKNKNDVESEYDGSSTL